MANNDEQRFGETSGREGGRSKVRAEGERPEQMIGENRTDGPSYISDVDREAMAGPKSEWQEKSAPAAGAPVSGDELRGLSLLGGSSYRDDALPGVSDPIRDGSGGPQERPGAPVGQRAEGGKRTNPPLVEDAGQDDGGITMSGGVAGGARGHGGASDRANPAEESKGGPGEYRSTSRLDLDHPTDEGKGR